MSKAKKVKIIAITLKIAFAIACLSYVASKQDWSQLIDTFSRLKLSYFLAALTLFFLCQINVAFRWFILLKIQSINISIFSTIKLHFLGIFYNNFLPSSIGGDFLRAWYVTKHTEKRLEAAFSVFFDRAIGLAGMTIMAIIGVFSLEKGAFDLNNSQGTESQVSALSNFLPFIVAFVAVLLLIVVVLLVIPKTRQKLFGTFKYFYDKFLRTLSSIKIYLSHPLTCAFALLITILGQSLTIIGFYLLGKNLGIDVSLKYYFIFFPTVWVTGAIPVSIGGIGLVEGLLTWLFIQAGALREASFALSICQRAIFLIVALPGIVIHIIGAHLPGQEFFVDSKETLD